MLDPAKDECTHATRAMVVTLDVVEIKRRGQMVTGWCVEER